MNRFANTVADYLPDGRRLTEDAFVAAYPYPVLLHRPQEPDAEPKFSTFATGHKTAAIDFPTASSRLPKSTCSTASGNAPARTRRSVRAVSATTGV